MVRDSMSKKPPSFLKVLVFLAAFACGACDSNEVRDTTPDPGVNTPTSDIVANVGPVNSVILSDQIAFAQSLGSNIVSIVQDNVGQEGDSGTGNFLVRYGTNEIFSDEETFTYDIDDSEDCIGGGTKAFSGSLDGIVTSGTGSLSGSYSLIYTDCVEEVGLEASDGSCSVSVEINGTFTNTVTLNFFDLDPYDINDYNLDDNIVSAAPVEFVNEEGATQSVTYSFDLFTSTYTENPTLDGTLTYSNQTYEVEAVDDAIGTSNAADICPAATPS